MTYENTNEALLQVFLFETSQNIEQLENIVLSNEASNSYKEGAIQEIFRIMHTIKGASAMMGFHDVSKLAHAMEDLFFLLREEQPCNLNCNELTDILLECIDYLKLELIKVQKGDALDGDYTILITDIKKLMEEIKMNNCKNASEDVINIIGETEKFYDPTIDRDCKGSWYKSIIHFEDDCEMENIRAYSVLYQTEEITQEIYYIPENILDNNESAEIIRRAGFQMYFYTEHSYEEMKNHLEKALFLKNLELICLKDDEELKKYFGKTEQNKEETSNTTKTANTNVNSITSQQSMINVSVTKLDKLMDLVGEMVIAEAMVIQSPDLNGLTLNNFNKAAVRLNKITNEIQDIVMSIRMVPLYATFHKMHRIVRDMCKKLDKEVELTIIGEETEVDKNIIEHIADPLMHLVRNALDHGIESKNERLTNGKVAKGSIILQAKNTGRDVQILIRDDGKGINKESVIKKAFDNGLLQKRNNEMQDSEIYRMIFLPGFSTKEEVSEYSGRGVGLDVVTKNVELIGGSIEIDSIYGKGTTITLTIPLTLAIIDGMNVKVGESYYTIPTTSIKEFFRPNEKDIIKDPDGAEMIMVRGLCYPIVRLHEYFHVINCKTQLKDGIIIMIEQDNYRVCVFADDLLGQQQVVVKALPEYINRTKKIQGLSGCTLLGDGNISLIIDVIGLFNKKER